MDNKARLELIGIQSQPLSDASAHVTISTSNGDIKAIYHPTEGTTGVVWVCGSLGGLDGPSFGIFDTLSQQLLSQGISSLRLDYRFPGDFNQCVLDVLAGVHFFEQEWVNKIALVGHSFGGAVVIMAGTMSPHVKAVMGLASQTFGARRVNELSPRPLLLIHGERDRSLPARCSRDIYQWANVPKELVIY